MTDAEQLEICRKRIKTLQEGIDSLLEVFDKTGGKRKDAMDLFLKTAEVETVTLEYLRSDVREYIAVIEGTDESRYQALQTFHNDVLRTDWVSAIVASWDMTPEQREYWLKVDSEGEANER